MRGDYPPLDINPVFPGLGNIIIIYYYYCMLIIPLELLLSVDLAHSVRADNKLLSKVSHSRAHVY